METRKVQVTGKSTFVVSLPKNWVMKVRIRNGDSVAMIPLPDGTLLVNPNLTRKERDQVKKVIPLDPDDLDQVFRRFIGAYLAGYSTIEFRSRGAIDKEVRQTVRRFSKNLIGPEIIEEGQSTITLRNLLDASDFSLAKGIRRMHVIVRDMHIEAMSSLRTGSQEQAEEVQQHDDEVDKLYWMIAKQFNHILRDVSLSEKMQLRPQEALGYLLVARSLERIGDHANRIASHAMSVRVEGELFDRLSGTSSAILELLDEAVGSFHKGRFEQNHSLVEKGKALYDVTHSIERELLTVSKEPGALVPLTFIVDSLERTRAYAVDIAEIGINHGYAIEYSYDMVSSEATASAGGEPRPEPIKSAPYHPEESPKSILSNG